MKRLTLILTATILTATVLLPLPTLANGDDTPARDRTAGPLHVDERITPPRALVKTPPSYTEAARKDRVQGTVVVRTVINEQGLVEEVEVLEGLSGGLTEAAVEAIETWQFEPALLDDEPVSVYYNLTINFRLDEDGEKGDDGT